MKRIIQRKMADHLGLFALLVLALGFISRLGDTQIGITDAALLQSLGFGLLGILQVQLLRRRLPVLLKDTTPFSRSYWYLVGIQSAILVLLLLTLYLFVNTSYLFLVGVSCCAFLLPFTAYGAWQTVRDLPPARHKTWFDTGEENTRVLSRSNGMDVRIRLRRRYFDTTDELFTIKASKRVRLGKLFTHFLLEDSGGMIENTDEDKTPFGWQFYKKEFGGLIRTGLDPEKTLLENQLKENSLIVAVRIRQDKPHSNRNKPLENETREF